MKKNVIWWPAVKIKDHNDKYGNFDYFEYSRKTWEFWCEKNDVELFLNLKEIFLFLFINPIFSNL